MEVTDFCIYCNVYMCTYMYTHPTDAIPTLSWWWGLSAPETLRAILAVA
jgi:hypothetical protein